MAKKKVLITGICGLLGQNLVRALGQDFNLAGVDLVPRPDFLKSLPQYEVLDITDSGAVKKALGALKPDIVINTAALTNVDACEREQEKADVVNHLAVRTLLEECGKKRKLVQISTDYIFDGQNGPYSDEAEPNPLSFYGTSKLRAEEAIQENPGGHLIVRTMVLYGTGRALKPDFISWVRASLMEGKEIAVVTDQTGNITLASNLAANIRVLLERDAGGVLSLAGSDLLSRFAIAVKTAEFYGLDSTLIKPAKTSDLKQAAPRPLKSGFVQNRARAVPGITLLTFKEQIKVYDDEQKSADSHPHV
jgi:dTDP-4-dehydrorhamnose reductase